MRACVSTRNNGEMYLDCSNIPYDSFLNAIQTKDIAKIKIMSKDDKINSNYEQGGPDVIVKHITGETEFISRKELREKYIHSSGHSIKIYKLRSSVDYLVYSNCNTEYKFIKLPKNCKAVLNNKTSKNGVYVIAKKIGDENIDVNSITFISSKAFKKVFKVPMQDAISNIGIGRYKKDKVNKNVNLEKDNSIKINIRKPVLSKPQDANESKYRFKVTRKVVNINGVLVGFELLDLSTNKTRNVNMNELTQLCVNKTVENVMVVRNQNGKLFLKGNGCSLERMQQVII